MSKIQAKECQNVEYKSSWHDKYLAWICGFANAQGATMFFGVDDDHEVVGLEHVDTLMEDIPNKIVTTMGIVVDVNLHELERTIQNDLAKIKELGILKRTGGRKNGEWIIIGGRNDN